MKFYLGLTNAANAFAADQAGLWNTFAEIASDKAAMERLLPTCSCNDPIIFCLERNLLSRIFSISREFCAYGKHNSRVSGKFWLLRVRTQRYKAFYAYKASAEIQGLHVSGES